MEYQKTEIKRGSIKSNHNMNIKIQLLKSQDATKAVFRGKFIALEIYVIKEIFPIISEVK